MIQRGCKSLTKLEYELWKDENAVGYVEKEKDGNDDFVVITFKKGGDVIYNSDSEVVVYSDGIVMSSPLRLVKSHREMNMALSGHGKREVSKQDYKWWKRANAIGRAKKRVEYTHPDNPLLTYGDIDIYLRLNSDIIHGSGKSRLVIVEEKRNLSLGAIEKGVSQLNRAEKTIKIHSPGIQVDKFLMSNSWNNCGGYIRGGLPDLENRTKGRNLMNRLRYQAKGHRVNRNSDAYILSNSF